MEKISDNAMKRAVLWFVLVFTGVCVLLVAYACIVVGYSLYPGHSREQQPVESLLGEPADAPRPSLPDPAWPARDDGQDTNQDT